MTRHEKLVGREARLEQTKAAIMDCIKKIADPNDLFAWDGLLPGEWLINFGPPHASSKGPSRHRKREGRERMVHVVSVPESWLDDVHDAGIAFVDRAIVLGAARRRCDLEGVEAWATTIVLPHGRKLEPRRYAYVVRFGGLTTWNGYSVEGGFDMLQHRLRVGLGL